jgi:hypothetical protein
LPVSGAASEAPPLHSAAALEIMAGIKSSKTELQLSEFMKLIYRAQLEHRIEDGEHDCLVKSIIARRPRTLSTASYGPRANGGRLRSHFPTRRRQSSPDRKKSRERRRTLGGSSALPPNLRAQYTEGHRAVLCIVAQEIKKRGFCDFAIDKIAALAGVCRTTVYYALKAAANLGHVSVTERRRPPYKNLTNIVRIISTEWRTWISRGLDGHGATAFKTSEMLSPTGNKDSLEGRLRLTYAQAVHANGRGNTPNSRSSISTGILSRRPLVRLSVAIGCPT